MATLNEITYDIMDVLKAGKSTDDDNITKEQVAYWVRTIRSKLIRQESNKGYSISENITQTLECIPLELVDASDCCGLELDCALLRTVNEIPDPIQGTSGDLISSISGPNLLATQVNYIEFSRVPYWGNNRFNADKPAAFRNGNRIYLFNTLNPGVININGVWNNPEEAANFTKCNGNSCFSWDDKYPVSEHMLDDIKKIIFDTNVRTLLMTQPDNINNNVDDTTRDQTKNRWDGRIGR